MTLKNIEIGVVLRSAEFSVPLAGLRFGGVVKYLNKV